MNMKLIIALSCLLFSSFCSQTWAYGGGGGSGQKSCKKPKLTQFTPAQLTAVNPGTRFSFRASALTNPKSIVVKVKKQAVEVRIIKKNNGYEISGKLPASLRNTHARIDIRAASRSNCKAGDGWLLKIAE